MDSVLEREERRKKNKYPRYDPSYQLMDPVTYTAPIRFCEPRPNKGLGLKARAETPWNLDVGIFKEYLKEGRPKLIADCFNFDWANIKLPRFKNSDVNEVKAEM